MKRAKPVMRGDESKIQLFNESGKELPINSETIRHYVTAIEQLESCTYSLLEVVFVDEPAIIEINKEYLDREYVTDIITFRYDEDVSNKNIEGTLYCCAQRIYEQALELNEGIEQEFKRILIHGLLHLCGYDDRSPEAKEKMTAKENFYLQKV